MTFSRLRRRGHPLTPTRWTIPRMAGAISSPAPHSEHRGLPEPWVSPQPSYEPVGQLLSPHPFIRHRPGESSNRRWSAVNAVPLRSGTTHCVPARGRDGRARVPSHTSTSIRRCVTVCFTRRPESRSRAPTPSSRSRAPSFSPPSSPSTNSTPGGSHSPSSSAPSRRSTSHFPRHEISAIARRTRSVARRGATGGNSSARPSRFARHDLATGHAPQRGARGKQTAAPNSIRA